MSLKGLLLKRDALSSCKYRTGTYLPSSKKASIECFNCKGIDLLLFTNYQSKFSINVKKH